MHADTSEYICVAERLRSSSRLELGARALAGLAGWCLVRRVAEAVRGAPARRARLAAHPAVGVCRA